jgi:hypothetical protein
MLIQLKQAEIVSAIKQYVAQQGINLAGKTVDIAFTSGRKENGLSADVTIEDHDIPGTATGDAVVVTKPVLAVVPSAPVLDKATNPDPVPDAPAAAPAAPDAAEVPKQDEATEAKTKPSLFG